MRSTDSLDMGLEGSQMSSVFRGIRSEGPIPYTSYDLFKHFAGVISLIKGLAHAGSLPITVLTRHSFGTRALDEVYILVAFVGWQFITLFSSGGGLISDVIGINPIPAVMGMLFLPLAFIHRYRAKRAAIRGEGYSYYQGMPWGFWTRLPVWGFALWARLMGWTLQRFYRDWRMPRILTHPTLVLSPERLQGIVRRFMEPLAIGLIGVSLAASGLAEGFGMFLVWIAFLIFLDETLAQRASWEAYLDQVDAEVIARETERLRSGRTDDISLTQGAPLVEVVDVKPLLGKWRTMGDES